MNISLRDLLVLQKESGQSVSACRSTLEAAGGDIESALELLARERRSPVATPFDESDWFTGPRLTRKMLQAVEKELHFKLPTTYVEVLYAKNGGVTRRDCYPVSRPTSWSADHISISGIRGIGGKFGISASTEIARNAEWGYPAIGVVFAETPTAGHTVLMFDYSVCGRLGEPRVVWVDVYGETPDVIVLAQNFAAFIKGLVYDETFGDSAGT